MWNDLKRAWVIAKKDAVMYYLKAPILLFGILMPLFIFLAYILGREIPPTNALAALVSIVVFFTATAVIPPIIPWENTTKTLERLLSMPIPRWAIFFGDVVSAFLFSSIVVIIPLIIGILIGVPILNLLILFLGVLIAILCYSAFGLALAGLIPAENPAQMMVVINSVKFPLIFISGIFLPLAVVPPWVTILSFFSPLTYFADLSYIACTGIGFFPLWFNFIILGVLSLLFLVIGIKLQEKQIDKKF
ncbi:MAG: ABC transporter permease [Candidatus Hodarchaeota archaeon]